MNQFHFASHFIISLVNELILTPSLFAVRNYIIFKTSRIDVTSFNKHIVIYISKESFVCLIKSGEAAEEPENVRINTWKTLVYKFSIQKPHNYPVTPIYPMVTRIQRPILGHLINVFSSEIWLMFSRMKNISILSIPLRRWDSTIMGNVFGKIRNWIKLN